MKKLLFIDRDGTLIAEPQDTYQIDDYGKLRFLPGAISALRQIACDLDFVLVMVTNQDGLGTASFPEEHFWGVQNLVVETLRGEGVDFQAIHIDRSFAHEQKETRKPRTGMLTEYLQGDYDLANSYVIGDRLTDVELAKNLGAKAIFLEHDYNKTVEIPTEWAVPTFRTHDWWAIYAHLRLPQRTAELHRKTHETDIHIQLDLDGTGQADIRTGLHFFDHMLTQIAKHSGINLSIHAQGDLEVDEHHTIEDTALALGECLQRALGNKLGMERYGFALPMDDCLATLALDFGGRPQLVWKARFRRERIGDVPTELFEHFFKSLCDAARCNLYVRSKGHNEHHKIEAIFKAFAKCLRQAVRRDPQNWTLPSSKGLL